jgi:prepilin-type N-terminal cleavage/methylation domain-containing protein
MRSRKGFTLIELMVVVLIVGILAAVAIPLMRGRIDSAKWSEAKAGMGTVVTALRAYASEKGTVAAGDVGVDEFSKIGIEDTDLDGTYFTHDAYEITSATAANGVLTCVITTTAVDSTRATKPTSPASMTLTVTAGEAVFSSSAD